VGRIWETSSFLARQSVLIFLLTLNHLIILSALDLGLVNLSVQRQLHKTTVWSCFPESRLVGFRLNRGWITAFSYLFVSKLKVHQSSKDNYEEDSHDRLSTLGFPPFDPYYTHTCTTTVRVSQKCKLLK